MGKNTIESLRDMLATLRSGYAVDGCLIPKNPQFSASFKASSATENCHMVPTRQKPGRRACLDGNYVRRKLPLQPHEYCIWDTELPGFGLRVRPTGRCYWFVRLRHRGKHRRASLSYTDDVDAMLARSQARRLLAEVALDGLPRRTIVKATPMLTDYVTAYWDDIAHYWKPSARERNRSSWKLDLAPAFGDTRVADVARADISRWRDECGGANESKFNRALPVLAALLKYAEQLHLRRKGSNPCSGMARYKRPTAERYLCRLSTGAYAPR